MSVEEKKGYCDLVVDNSGSLDGYAQTGGRDLEEVAGDPEDTP